MSKLSVRSGAILAFAVGCCAVMTPFAMARGGGFHGGGFHGGGFHGGGFHGGFHAYHPYRPSQHHFDHHNGRFDHHAYHHHYRNWHYGGWGPGFWGGAALGYGLGYEPWGYGGDTYIDNTTEVSTDAGDTANDDNSDSTTNSVNNNGGFATDDWPELGINTYAGQYGGTQGQVVVRVVPNSGAARAGIVPGDVILSLNGKPTPSADAMESALEGANLKFSAEVWDARTGRKSTLSGSLDPKTPATPKTASATKN